MKCAVCGEEFIKNGNRQKYCSEKCARKVMRTEARDYIKKRTKDNIECWNNDVMIAYDGCCAICGWAISTLKDKKGRINKKRGLEVHHIVSVSDGGTNEMENIILLCPNHHKMADMGLIEEDVLKEIAKKAKDGLPEAKEKGERELAERIWRTYHEGVQANETPTL